MKAPPACKLALEDGAVFTGHLLGAPGSAAGEAVFNTAMTGYQEVLTDPSYRGQIVVMTYPLIGNYGINDEDMESGRPHLSAFVVKQVPPRYSNPRAVRSLQEYLCDQGIIGLANVDTRALTRRLRDHGCLRAAISSETLDDAELIERARGLPLMTGQNLVAQVAGLSAGPWPRQTAGQARWRVVAMDCGIKHNILRRLAAMGCDIVSVSGLCPAEAVLEHRPDGVLLGNGPGDPQAAHESIATVRRLIGQVPIFGICLGHQLLAAALGGRIYKLKFGHHGANHPVRNLATGRIEITSQNHNFAVATDSLDAIGAVPTHINLNDGSLEGFAHTRLPVFAVQFHPEAAPGPHDTHYLFDWFCEMMQTRQVPHPPA